MEKNENGYSSERNRISGNRCAGTGEIWGMNGNNSGQYGERNFGTEPRQLAMVYSPYQCWRMTYTPDDALNHGTLFEELYKPLMECDNGK